MTDATEPTGPGDPIDPLDEGLGEWLLAAYAPGGEVSCPPPEAFLEAAEGRLPEAEARALDLHADGCPACAAERDLARLFHGAPEGAAAEDLDFVVGQLRRASPVSPARLAAPVATVIPFPAAPAAPSVPEDRRAAASRSRSPVAWRLAAAVFLLLAAGLAFRLYRLPGSTLPAPELGGVVRGAEVTGLRPSGDLALPALPAELSWEPYPGAASYRVTLSAVDGETLWEAALPAVTEPSARLPAEVAARLHRAVLYRWQVAALGPDGRKLAASGPAELRAAPAPEEGGR
jgi:hypothetical protein